MMAAAVFQYRSRRAEHAPEQGRILQRFVGIASVVDSASMSRIGVKAPGMIVVIAPVGFCWQNVFAAIHPCRKPVLSERPGVSVVCGNYAALQMGV
jgi:hypothetical protein